MNHIIKVSSNNPGGSSFMYTVIRKAALMKEGDTLIVSIKPGNFQGKVKDNVEKHLVYLRNVIKNSGGDPNTYNIEVVEEPDLIKYPVRRPNPNLTLENIIDMSRRKELGLPYVRRR